MSIVELQRAAEHLAQGQPVAFGTETVYGLGALATDAQAVRRVFALKGRPADNPLIVHVHSRDAIVPQIAARIDAASAALMDAFWPGPLTLLLDRAPGLPDEVTAGLGSVGVRMPAHRLALALIERAGPLVAPSANLSGLPSPTTAQHVLDDYQGSVPVLDGGPCQVGLESTVVDVRSGQVVVLRPGKLSAQDLAQVCGLPIGQAEQNPQRPASPGMKYRHYAPSAKVAWLTQPGPQDAQTMVLALDPGAASGAHVVHFEGDLVALAQQLYARFRQADELGCRQIFIEPFEVGDGVSQALLNRIEKAIGGGALPQA